MVANADAERLDVSVRDLGGIDAVETAFEPGVTVLVGRNATNRTSLLQSILAALGGSTGQLRSSADEGRVTIDAGDRTATREFTRRGDSVVVDGDPYTDETALVDQFAGLLEANPARRAVERGDGDALREIVMAPIDTEALQAQIESTRRELDDVADRIEEIERRASNLPALEERRQQRASELSDVEAEIDELRAAVDDLDAASGAVAGGRDADGGEAAVDGEDDVVDGEDVDDGDVDDGEVDGGDDENDLAEALRDARQEYERVRDDRSTQSDAIDSLEAELETVEAELAELEADLPDGEAAVADVDDLEAEIERLTREERALSSTVSSLLSIVEFNEELLEGDGDLPLGDDGDPLDELDPASRTVECWTCGTAVERGEIDDRLADLRAVAEEKRAERESLASTIEDRREALAAQREHQDRLEELRERRERIEDEIEERRDRLADLESRESELRERVTELESRTADREGDAGTERVEQYQRLSELEYERGQLEEAIDALDDEIASIEALTEEREALVERREALESELASLRDRIETVETDAIDTFNEHAATVLELLAYQNLERVWLERRSTDGDAGATFDLHVVRADEEGRVYEDTVDHLSESEREVIGLVVALAGYLVHDVHEAVPVMALDSLEAIDADRIATLVDYFADYAPYVLVALLPGDAQALPDEYDRVEMYRD